MKRWRPLTHASTITVGVYSSIISSNEGMQAASEVLLAKDLGRALTAAPVSIK